MVKTELERQQVGFNLPVSLVNEMGPKARYYGVSRRRWST